MCKLIFLVYILCAILDFRISKPFYLLFAPNNVRPLQIIIIHSNCDNGLEVTRTFICVTGIYVKGEFVLLPYKSDSCFAVPEGNWIRC